MFILIEVFIAKILSNMLDTARTIFTQRNKALIAALALTAASLASNFAIKAIADADGYLVIVVASVAAGVGCWFAIMIANKYFKELGIKILLSDKKETMQEIREYMANNHITNIAVDSYKRDSWEEKSITLIVIPDTKEKMKMVEQYVASVREEKEVKIKMIPS